MPILKFSAIADVYHHTDSNGGEVTLNPDHLKPLHGMYSDEEVCSDYIDPALVESLELTGGVVRFYYDTPSKRLRVSTCYGLEVQPTEAQQRQLQSETEAQWSDGIGSGAFSMLHNELLSRSLALALLYEDAEFADIFPDFTVDAFPIEDDRDIKVEWSEEGMAYDELLEDLRALARQGEPTAQAHLGELYLYGGLGPDWVQEGIELLSQAADNGSEVALSALASETLRGKHIAADPEKAVALYESAIAGGSAIAAYQLGEAYKEGLKLPHDPVKALQYLEHAAQLGFGPALAELGDCYEFGLCVETDLDEALDLYATAVNSGFDPALIAYERVCLQLGGELPPYTNHDDPESMFRSDDPEMAEAIREAQGSLHQVIEAIESAIPETVVTLCVNLDQDETECYWLSELKFEKGLFSGKIKQSQPQPSEDSEPSMLDAHPNEVIDWAMTQPDGSQSGGFTVDIFKRRESSSSQE